MSNGLAELSASFNSVFVKSREDWLEALILANFVKTDEEIVNKAVESWKTSIDANISYHEETAKLVANDNPLLTRQHRLLATIYSKINNR